MYSNCDDGDVIPATGVSVTERSFFQPTFFLTVAGEIFSLESLVEHDPDIRVRLNPIECYSGNILLAYNMHALYTGL